MQPLQATGKNTRYDFSFQEGFPVCLPVFTGSTESVRKTSQWKAT